MDSDGGSGPAGKRERAHVTWREEVLAHTGGAGKWRRAE